jgi:tetraacyldisaccharide 4'-kinase
MGQSLPVKAASAMFGAAVKARNALYDSMPFLSHKAGRPVISIGGLRAGGTGKTPMALLVGEYLSSKGFDVAFLSRGYRRKDKRLRIVKPGETVSWEDIGDEPCLLHERLPQSWLGIGGDRCRTAARLSKLLPQRAVFVLDDGFQHRSLRRDLDIVCLHDSLLNDRLIPLGWLREPAGALQRARAALIIGTADRIDALETLRSVLEKSFPGLCSAVLFQEIGLWTNAGDGRIAPTLPVKNPLLVCGIARPERFITMVRKAGITPCAERIFPDHHRYGIHDFGENRKLYSNGIITTEKDAARLKTLENVPSDKLWFCSVTLRFAEEKQKEKLFSLIDACVKLKEKQP